jgi:hypothetical protein
VEASLLPVVLKVADAQLRPALPVDADRSSVRELHLLTNDAAEIVTVGVTGDVGARMLVV